MQANTQAEIASMLYNMFAHAAESEVDTKAVVGISKFGKDLREKISEVYQAELIKFDLAFPEMAVGEFLKLNSVVIEVFGGMTSEVVSATAGQIVAHGYQLATGKSVEELALEDYKALRHAIAQMLLGVFQVHARNIASRAIETDAEMDYAKLQGMLN